MRQRTFLFSILSIILTLSACSGNNNSKTAPVASEDDQGKGLTIFAAAALTEAFTELGERFEELHPGISVSLNFAGSHQLAQQIAQGAPADVFASANLKQMEVAIDTERVEQEQMRVFAGNRLVIVFPADNPARLGNLGDLGAPNTRVVLASEAAPVGQYALEYLDNASQEGGLGSDYKAKVLENVVSYEENVRAVLSKVLLGEADAGIVYISDLTNLDPQQVGAIEIPTEWNPLASYYIAPLNDSMQSDLAQDFIEFVLSMEGQDILRKYGLLPVS